MALSDKKLAKELLSEHFFENIAPLVQEFQKSYVPVWGRKRVNHLVEIAEVVDPKFCPKLNLKPPYLIKEDKEAAIQFLDHVATTWPKLAKEIDDNSNETDRCFFGLIFGGLHKDLQLALFNAEVRTWEIDETNQQLNIGGALEETKFFEEFRKFWKKSNLYSRYPTVEKTFSYQQVLQGRIMEDSLNQGSDLSLLNLGISGTIGGFLHHNILPDDVVFIITAAHCVLRNEEDALLPHLQVVPATLKRSIGTIPQKQLKEATKLSIADSKLKAEIEFSQPKTVVCSTIQMDYFETPVLSEKRKIYEVPLDYESKPPTTDIITNWGFQHNYQKGNLGLPGKEEYLLKIELVKKSTNAQHSSSLTELKKETPATEPNDSKKAAEESELKERMRSSIIAVKTTDVDIAFIPVKAKAHGCLFCEDKPEWLLSKDSRIEPGSTVVKVGATTGFTRGRLSRKAQNVIFSENEVWTNMVEVSWEDQPFTRGGDSGSLYYLVTSGGHFLPFAVHRGSPSIAEKIKSNQSVSYGTPLETAFEAIEKHFGIPMLHGQLQICAQRNHEYLNLWGD